MLAPGFSFFKCNIQTVNVVSGVDANVLFEAINPDAWIHVSVSVLLGWWSGSHCAWIHPMVCLVVST